MKPIVLPPLDFLDQLPHNLRQIENIRLDLVAIYLSYADYCDGLDIDQEDRIFLIMKKHMRILYDDGQMKNFKEKLDHPDLRDMMAQLYPKGEISEEVFYDIDPGRFRVKQFFDSVYGATIEQVKANLIPIKFIDKTVLFNGQNGAAKALMSVSRKLGILSKNMPEIRHNIFPLVSTFNWRLISGTRRPSPHTWGIAIDLHALRGAYWRWGKQKEDVDIIRLRKETPIELVNIFEESGFIWGGKWSHFDTIHFEYRPELLLKTKLIQNRYMLPF